MNSNELQDIKRDGGILDLRDSWSIVRVHGSDAQSFLNSQLTSRIDNLDPGSMRLSARLNRSGQVVSYFYVGHCEKKGFFLWVPKELVSVTIKDLEKFIIMEDVEMEVTDLNGLVALGGLGKTCAELGLHITMHSWPATWIWQKNAPRGNQISGTAAEALRLLSGFPSWGEGVDDKTLINETRLNELAVDYKKGCFLGQETVAKIQNNRGAAFYPVLIETDSSEKLDWKPGQKLYSREKKVATYLNHLDYDNHTLLLVKLARQERVNATPIELSADRESFIQGSVRYLPYSQAQSWKELSVQFFESGAENFRDGDEVTAVQDLEAALHFDPVNDEAYESLGVILGRQEKYEQAIALMDKLQEVDPNSVMAHTNKSLYLMKLGRIEEAEKEKGEATFKSFSRFGEEAKQKKEREEQSQKQEQEMLQREKMFYQVLEIDELDEIANYGLADIAYHRSDFPKSIEHLKIVLEQNPKYSTAYVLLGKAHEALKEMDQAKSIYQKGILAAKSRGDLMPANEMQSRLSKL